MSVLSIIRGTQSYYFNLYLYPCPRFIFRGGRDRGRINGQAYYGEDQTFHELVESRLKS